MNNKCEAPPFFIFNFDIHIHIYISLTWFIVSFLQRCEIEFRFASPLHLLPPPPSPRPYITSLTAHPPSTSPTSPVYIHTTSFFNFDN